jgi:hypothetical protein
MLDDGHFNYELLYESGKGQKQESQILCRCGDDIPLPFPTFTAGKLERSRGFLGKPFLAVKGRT